MLSPAFITRVRYQFDTFLAKGGSNIFMSLFFVFLVTLMAIALLRGILLWAVPSDLYSAVDQNFLRQLYVIFLQMKIGRAHV